MLLLLQIYIIIYNDLQICCYKCGNERQLCVEEKINNDTKEIIEKNFICIKCANLFQANEGK